MRTTHPLYNAWAGMKRRCTQTYRHNHKHYAGIKICWRWHWANPNGFEAFIADMGPKPSPQHSLDRINSWGDYEPGNCRWATPTQQIRNKRDSTLVQTPSGIMHIRDAAERYRSAYPDYDEFRRKVLAGAIVNVFVYPF